MSIERTKKAESTVYKFNTVHDLNEANRLIKAKYGQAAKLEQFGNDAAPRFRFVGVDIIARYPSYGFKSVTKAFNGLLAHENGFIGEKDYQTFKEAKEPKPVIETSSKEAAAMKPPEDLEQWWVKYVELMERVEYLEKLMFGK